MARAQTGISRDRPKDHVSALGEPGLEVFVGLVLAITVVRLIGQHFSIVDLDVEEAQYWDWSRELAWGYFSKPPLIAWVNAAAGLVCGDSVACIRAPAPIFYLGTSLLIYGAANVLYGRTVAFWAGLTAALAVGVSFSARIMTTDVILLFCWALALYAYVKLLRTGALAWALLLGVALGLGLLAKYAMAYFVLSMVLAGLVNRDARTLLRSPLLWLAVILGVLILAPNIFWNIANGFPTAKATAGYTEATSHLHFDEALGFIAAQFGVAGPITFYVLLGLFFRFRASDVSDDDRMLLLFALPPLAVVTANAIWSGQSNANWAATAMVAAFVVTSAWLVRGHWRRLLSISVGIGVVAQVALLLADPFADRITIPGMVKGDVFRRVLGWRLLGDEVGKLATENDVASVAVEGRGEISTLTYYRRNDPRPLFIWPSSPSPTNQFEMAHPLTAAAPDPILLVTACADAARLSQYFTSVNAIGSFEVAAGPTSSRPYSAFLLSGAIGEIGPLARCG